MIAHNSGGIRYRYTQRQLKLRFFFCDGPWHAPSSHLAKSAVSVHAQYNSLSRFSIIAEFRIIVSIGKFTTDNTGIQSVFFLWGICNLAVMLLTLLSL